MKSITLATPIERYTLCVRRGELSKQRKHIPRY